MYKDIESQFSDTTQYIPFRHRLGYVRYLQGDTTAGIALIREQLKLDMERHQNLRGYGVWTRRGYYYDLACSNSFLGLQEEALAWLDSAFQRGFISKWFMENDPLLENVRESKEFHKIQRELADRQRQQSDAYLKAIDQVKYIPPEIKINAGQQPSL
jgi:hypothetical protein